MKVCFLISLLVALVLCNDDDSVPRKADYTLTLQDKQDLLTEVTIQGAVNPYFIKKWVYQVDVVILATYFDKVAVCSSIDPTGYPGLCLFENSITTSGDFDVPFLSSIAAYQKRGYDLIYKGVDYNPYDMAVFFWGKKKPPKEMEKHLFPSKISPPKEK
eukprot:TRINITY_DN5263_c0_g1_i3.p1 TRINITY_DN5263_c0_g1~~TRINITY_DN5263_c0_g1_i3.p1  ORF type:complete len:159 (-),score=7.22 TRINITY_DN5263_c0_g1_i3:4-480(-)